MRCAKCRELISRSFDEDLGEGERGQLVEHLSGCSDCQRHHVVLEEGRDLFAGAMVDAPENFEWKVQLGIQRALRDGAVAEEAPRYGWAFWGPTAASATAVAALVLVAGSFLIRTAPTDSPVREFDLPGVLTDASSPSGGAAPDLSGARAVEGLEVDAFGDGYGIRTVGDHLNFSSVRDNYPVRGRAVVRRSEGAILDEVFRGMPSQTLHLRLVNTKLRGVPEGSRIPAPASTSMADSAAIPESPRR